MNRRSLLFAVRAAVLMCPFLAAGSAPTIVAEGGSSNFDPAGMIWERHGDWHLNGSPDRLRLGELLPPGGLITAGTEDPGHSLIILLPDGQRLLCECFEAKTWAQGF